MLGEGEYILMGHSAFTNVVLTAADLMLKSGRKVSKVLVADPCHLPLYPLRFRNFAAKLKVDPSIGDLLPPSDLWRTRMLADSGDVPEVNVPVIALMATQRGVSNPAAKWEPVEESMAKLESLCDDLSVVYVPCDHLEVFRDDNIYDQLSPIELKPRQANINLRLFPRIDIHSHLMDFMQCIRHFLG